MRRLKRAIRRRWDDGCGAVYLVQAENGLFKIGSSRNPMKRLGTLRTGSPIGIDLVHIIITWQYTHQSLERALQRRFAHRRAHGEWFALTEEDVVLIEAIKQEPKGSV